MLQGIEQIDGRGFALATDDDVDGGFAVEDVAGVIGRVDAAVDGGDVRAAGLNGAEHPETDRVGGGGTGVAGEHDTGAGGGDSIGDGAVGEGVSLGVEQSDRKAGLAEGASEEDEAERDLVTNAEG